MNDDIKSAFGFAARVAIDHSVPLDSLLDLIRKEYETAERVGKQKDASKGEKFEPVHEVAFVTYVDPKKGPLLAHVREVLVGGRVNLRTHQTAQPDTDKDDVPFSAKPSPGHWSYR